MLENSDELLRHMHAFLYKNPPNPLQRLCSTSLALVHSTVSNPNAREGVED